ncbi:MAG: DUF2809 domain-containing protein [Flavihumibacter sp.]
MRRRQIFFLLFLLLFLVECLIALYMHDRIVRPYVGDYLVVIMLYCLLQAVWPLPVRQACAGVLLFAYMVEILQYLNLLGLLGLTESKLARVVLGSSFEWIDIVAYTAGIATVYWVETSSLKGRNTK